MRIEILNKAMMKQNSACSHCRIKFQKKKRKEKKVKSKNAGREKESKNLKTRNHEHYRKIDKRCESKHIVRQQTGSKFFSSHQRELQKQKRRQGGADHIF